MGPVGHNFFKFLVSRDGRPLERWIKKTSAQEMEPAIVEALKDAA